ncbi:MAG: MBL fold metallo-hydrolase [Acidobacteriota bacterium]|jgi:glyoxylase-like metal-dependent hydrolase (beta-lactamase superfamily II)
MLRSSDHGPVRYFSLAKSWAGRIIMATGVFFVDGTLIDTGPANAQVEFARILGKVDAEQVVLTHHHEDHIGNAAFAANHLDRPPLAHGLALPFIRHPERLPLYRRVTWGTPPPVQAEALGKTLHTREHAFEVIHTPGHAPDHVVLYEPNERWLFAGDLYISRRLAVVRPDEDVGALIASLRRLMELPDCTLFCQHTGVHESHQRSLGAKLDFLLGVQNKATTMHEEGRSVAEITRALALEKPIIKLVSRGQLSARNLVAALLRDAGVDDDA